MRRPLILGSIFIAAMALGSTACSKYYNLAKLDAGSGRYITIFAERNWENEQAIYYRIEVQGKVVVPDSYTSSIDPEEVAKSHLKLVTNKAGSIVAVIEEKLPQKIWVLHNFATQETWPGCQSGSHEQCENRAHTFLEQLQKDHPEVTFVL